MTTPNRELLVPPANPDDSRPKSGRSWTGRSPIVRPAMSARRRFPVGWPTPGFAAAPERNVASRRNVLLTGGPRRSGLVHAFHRALRRVGGGAVIVAGPDRLSPVPGDATRAF